MDDEKKIPLPAIIAIAVVALGIAGFVGFKALGPSPTAAVQTEEKTQNDVIAQIVKKTNGDWSKVTDDDKAKLAQIAGAWGERAYMTKKQELGIK